MKVRVNSLYRYDPCLIDMVDGKTSLHQGDIVRVKNMYGCPSANTMGHCYVFNPITDTFIGMVCTESLETASEDTKRIVRNARVDRFRCGYCGVKLTSSGACSNCGGM